MVGFMVSRIGDFLIGVKRDFYILNLLGFLYDGFSKCWLWFFRVLLVGLFGFYFKILLLKSKYL